MQTQKIVEGCIAGDPEAWRTFVDTYGPQVEQRMERLLASHGWRPSTLQIAELRQGVFDRLMANECRALRAYRGISTFEGWLAGVASNVFREWTRRSSTDANRFHSMGAAQERLPDPGPSVPDRLTAQEELGALREAVDHLPERDRLLVTLYVLRGLPASDVARAMGVSPNSISPLLVRVYPRLRRALRRRGTRSPP